MSKSPKGLRIGNYRITPLGLIVLFVLILLIAGAIVLVVLNPFEGMDLSFKKEPEVVATSTPEPVAATPTPSPTPEPTPRSATIRSLGEIAMQNNLLKSALVDNSFDFSGMFSEVSDIMGDADYTVANVEGVMGDSTNYSGTGSKLITPASLIGTLKDNGVDMLLLANDHALDGGFAQQQAMVQNCVSAGMDYVGAAASSDEKNTPNIKEINGIKVGFLGYTTTLNGNEKKTDAAAVSYGVNLVAKSDAAKDIAALKSAGAEVIIAYMSWGEMFNRSITADQQAIAKFLVQAGVDVIIGYNPHVVQPAVWLEAPMADGTTHRTLCLCATGNFLSDQRSQYADSGIIFEFTIQERDELGTFDIVNPVYIPTYVWRSEGEGGKYNYRTLAVGEWLEKDPEGMVYTDMMRMRQVWAEMQTIMGSDVATISAN